MVTPPSPATRVPPVLRLTEDEAFFQERVATFGAWTGLLGGSAYVVRFAAALAIGRPEHLRDEDMLAHLLAVAIVLVPWLAFRSVPRAPALVARVETACLLAAALAWCWMGSAIHGTIAIYIVLLAMTYNAFARAVLVPSSARRTLLLTGLCGLGFFFFLRAPPPCHLPVDHLPQRIPSGKEVVVALMWWSLSTAIAVNASRLIFGLRREVSAARSIGQYTLEERIGAGSMGVVYRAQHSRLRRPTAIKLLPPARAGKSGIARFEKEVQLTATLTHPNTITVFDYGRTPDGTFYYAMELLDGESLEDLVAACGPLPPSRVVHLLRQAAGALTEAHAAGLVHRDIKPSNLVVCRRGGVWDVIKVLDFGIVREGRVAGNTAASHADIVGTPHYLSPEAILSPAEVGPASDLYALGAVGYFLLTGHPVFEGATVVELCSQQVSAAPVPPSARSPVPADLEGLVLACLAKSPHDRPASAKELERALGRCGGPAWTEDDAETFWTAHAERIRARRARRLAEMPESPLGSGGTIAPRTEPTAEAPRAGLRALASVG